MTKAKIAIIVAGGKGERMHADIPKQFIEIQGKPILMHTLESFHRYDAAIQLIVVLHSVQIEFWNGLCQKHAFSLSHLIVAGGQTRFQSVKNGLDTVNVPALVAVHDGVRPLVSNETIDRCMKMARENGNAVPVMPVVESLRELDGNRSQAVNREKFVTIQTPQVFRVSDIKGAYAQGYDPVFTDDATVLERSGVKINLVEGNRENIKITHPEDLVIAEALTIDFLRG